jgi:uncharacterized membrane protein YfcA
MVFLVSGAFGLVMFGLAGEVFRSDVDMAAISVPAMVTGISLGGVLRKYVQQDLFKKIVLVLLTVGGVSSVLGGLLG